MHLPVVLVEFWPIMSQLSLWIKNFLTISYSPFKIRLALSEISCLTQPQSSAHSAVLFIAWGTISLSYICMSECTPTDWFCLQPNRFHALPLCVMSPWISLKRFSPDKHHCYQTRWFYTCNPTCTWGMMKKHNFLLFQLRRKVKHSDKGMLAEQDDVFEAHRCFTWRFYVSFLTMERTNLIFTNTNWTAKEKKFQHWISVVLLAHVLPLNENK